MPFYDPDMDSSTDWLPLHRLASGGGNSVLLVDVRWPAGAACALRAATAAGVPSVLDADTAPLEVNVPRICAFHDGHLILR